MLKAATTPPELLAEIERLVTALGEEKAEYTMVYEPLIKREVRRRVETPTIKRLIEIGRPARPALRKLILGRTRDQFDFVTILRLINEKPVAGVDWRIDPPVAAEWLSEENAARIIEIADLNFPCWESKWTPDGRELAVLKIATQVRFRDAATFLELPGKTIGKEGVFHFAFCRNRPELLAFDDRADLCILALDAGASVAEAKVHRFKVSKRERAQPMIEFSPDGTLIAIAEFDRAVQLRKVPDGALIRSIEIDGREGGLRPKFSPNGKLLAVGNRNDVTTMYDVETGNREPFYSQQLAQTQGLEFSPNGRKLAVGYVTGAVRIFDVGTGKMDVAFDSKVKESLCVAWSGDGTLLVTGGRYGPLAFWNSDGELLHTLETQETVYHLSLHPDGHLLAASGSETTQIYAVPAASRP